MIAALVPACGASRRMGRPKLTLPLGGSPLIGRVIGGLRGASIERVLVVVPPESQPGALHLRALAQEAGAEVLEVDPVPEQMGQTVRAGLEHLVRSSVAPLEAIVLTPADALGVTPDVVSRLLAADHEHDADVIVATHSGKWGHPVLLRWHVAELILSLPAERGVNSIVRDPRWRVCEIPCEEPAVIADLDTPADLARWTRTLDPPPGPTDP